MTERSKQQVANHISYDTGGSQCQSDNSHDDDEEEQQETMTTTKPRTSSRRLQHQKEKLQHKFREKLSPLEPSFLDILPESYRHSFRYRPYDQTVLLHGILDVQIIKAHGLRDRDLGFLSCNQEVSDPYVTLHVGGGPHSRLLKTSYRSNNLNPIWNEHFTVNICHFVHHHLELRVKDWNHCGMNRLGKIAVPVSDLLKWDDDDDQGKSKELRTGVHRIDYLDGKKRHGSLEYYIQYIPAHMIQPTMAVPGTYFPAKPQNDVRFYMNADMDPGCVPYKYQQAPQCCWKDMYDSLCDAQEFIYIAGWAVDHTQSLLRGDDLQQVLDYLSSSSSDGYSPYIGELLKQKAAEGVTVNMLTWDDQTSNPLINSSSGVMGTGDEALRRFFAHTPVNCELVSIGFGEVAVKCCENLRNAFFYTHHQKTVICDQPDRSLVAFLGGIDLTKGRWDDGHYSLFRTLQTKHAGDFHQACLAGARPTVGPRESWHDIHMRVQGPGAIPVLENFEERWRRQVPTKLEKLVPWKELGLEGRAVEADDTFCTQLFRSIDARTAKFDTETAQTNNTTAFADIQGVRFDEPQEHEYTHNPLSRPRPRYKQTFTAHSADGFALMQNVRCDKGRLTDTSCQTALIHYIRQAQHVVYMESQYFLSSASWWPHSKSSNCRNLVAAELAVKICQKIDAGERFAAYILLPMWSEGLPDSHSVQEILNWQHLTMESMYREIARCIQKRHKLLQEKDQEFDAQPCDYLNFYCLGTRETLDGSQATDTPQPGTEEERVVQARRYLVYVHSKMCIADDTVALIGSANINERSLSGTRDTEISMASWQTQYLASEDSIPHGDVHDFRLQCWSHLTGTMEEVFRHPSSLECVRRFNEIAQANWQRFLQEEPCEMDSTLLPYPITVNNKDGKVRALTKNGKFPDTKAKILGKNTIIPNLLTT